MYSSLIHGITKDVLSEMSYPYIISANSLLSNPEPINPRLYIRRITLNVILNMAFGVHTKSINDPLFKRLGKLLDDLTLIFSNVNRKLDYFPILKYFPGYGMKKVGYLKLACLGLPSSIKVNHVSFNRMQRSLEMKPNR